MFLVGCIVCCYYVLLTDSGRGRVRDIGGLGCGERLTKNGFYSFSESSDEIEERLDRPKLGGPLTSEVVPNSLYHPITIFDRFRSSNIIWAMPINNFLSKRPYSPQTVT